MGISADTTSLVNTLVQSQFSGVNVRTKAAAGIMKKIMDTQETMASQLLESMPDIQSLNPNGGVGQILDIYV